MNKNENKALVALAEEQQDHGDHAHVGFYWFLIGWMSNHHHKEMAEAARAWLDTHYPEKLEEFDSLHKEN